MQKIRVAFQIASTFGFGREMEERKIDGLRLKYIKSDTSIQGFQSLEMDSVLREANSLFQGKFLLSFLQSHFLEGSSYATCDHSCFSSFFLSYVGCSFRPWHYIVLLHVLQNRTKQSSPFFCSTVFQIFQDISNVFSKSPSVRNSHWSYKKF